MKSFLKMAILVGLISFAFAGSSKGSEAKPESISAPLAKEDVARRSISEENEEEAEENVEDVARRSEVEENEEDVARRFGIREALLDQVRILYPQLGSGRFSFLYSTTIFPLSSFYAELKNNERRGSRYGIHVTNISNIQSILKFGFQTSRHRPGMSSGKGCRDMISESSNRNYFHTHPEGAHQYVNHAIMFGYIPAVVVFEIDHINYEDGDMGEKFTRENIPSKAITQIWLPDLQHAGELKKVKWENWLERFEKVREAREEVSRANSQSERSLIGMARLFATQWTANSS